MTYRKICINENAAVQMTREAVPQEKTAVKEENVHCPEIVINRNKYTAPQRQNKGIFRIPLGKIIAVTVLCSVSFAIGCSVTNEEIAEYMKTVATISHGSTADKKEVPQNTENITFYEKYMTKESSAETESRIEYLSAERINVEQPVSEHHDSPQPVAVSGITAGNTAVDGETVFSVVSDDMSVSDIHLLLNQTKYKPDTYVLAASTPKALENLAVKPDEPLVLVLHTHGTECYNSYKNENYIGTNTPSRSENTNENVVGVGEKLVSVLSDFGIPTVHSRKMCDSESFVNAYSTSYDEAKSYLEKYPSIRFVIDLHRDAIELSDGSKKKPVFDSFGKKSAQLMFVVGTDQAGAKHPGWEENLSLALTLQSEIGNDYPQLFRGINLRTASFNQQLSPGYMLLECGSAANTLEEAENAAELFATGLARVIIKYAK